MKKLGVFKFWLFICGLAVFFVGGAYIVNFYDQPISSDPNNWADFGSYIGGLLAPLFALFAFFAAIRTYQEGKKQKSLDATLVSIEKFEMRFKQASQLVVSCSEPWLWGKDFDAGKNIEKLPLRTLLHSDSLDWKPHLTDLRDSFEFHFQPSGELFQDRDMWLEAKISCTGLFRYLELYRNNGGDAAIIEFYESSYEVPYNRLLESDYETVS
jgi:hypothetical protein